MDNHVEAYRASSPTGSVLRRAAFGELPGLAETIDHTVAVELATNDTPLRRWLAAVAFGGLGRYAAAATLLERLVVGAQPLPAALAASTLASHRRQLGAHQRARALDSAALRMLRTGYVGAGRAWQQQWRVEQDPDGIDCCGAVHDALLGLAADAVGLGRIDIADRILDRARSCVRGWRASVRQGWVEAETRLAAGEVELSVTSAERAASEARSVGSPRHIAKSDLVLGAAYGARPTESGRRHAAARLDAVLEVSLERVFLPFTWPSALLLVEMRPQRARHYQRIARNALSRVFDGTDPEGRRLAEASPWVPTSLL